MFFASMMSKMVFLNSIAGGLMVLMLSFFEYGMIYFNLSNYLEYVMISDYYSVTFSLTLFLIATCVTTWSYYYMDSEFFYRRFMGLVLLFLISMLFLIFSPSFLFSIIGWDGLGVTSFLLVIFYSNRKSLGSGMLTGMMNRIGDALYLLVIPFLQMGSSSYWVYLMFLLCLTKSAQYPFSSWLPAAMAAPTPVSALVHSSTLVTAGLYLLIRFNFIDMSILLPVGSVTMMMASLCACAEQDVKKIIALSTLSQLGVMMVSLGLLSKKLCFFHLLTHALFKALMFLCVGVMIHSAYGNQESREMNYSKQLLLPSTMLVMAIFSLCGFPFMSGFYSKDKIIEYFFHGKPYIMYMIFLLGVGLSAVYSFQLIYKTIWGNKLSESKMTESNFSLWYTKWPMSILGISTISGGFLLSHNIALRQAIQLTPDYMIPLMMIVGGMTMGLYMTKLKFPLMLNSLFLLAPVSQNFSKYSLLSENPLKLVDSGYLEWSIPKGLSYNSYSINQLWYLITPLLMSSIISVIVISSL